MRLEAGPVFSAVLIGGGIGYMIFKKTGSPFYGIGAAIAICAGEYLFLMWADRFRAKK